MINICFCLDNKLKDKVFTVINSINRNTSEDIKYFLILEKGFDQEYVNKYRSLSFNVVENVDIPEIVNYHKSIVKSKAMFYRWLIADLFPMIDRVIYLDVDVMLNTDIKKLWDVDLGEKIIGMVPCSFGQTVRMTERYQGSINEMDAYLKYNCDIDKRNYLSGQLLIDLKKWRELCLTNILIDFVVSYKCADMIALNVVCQKYIYELDYRWSAPANRLDENFQAYAPCIKKDYSDAYLFHFHGKIKPWDPGYPNKKLLSMWEGYSK